MRSTCIGTYSLKLIKNKKTIFMNERTSYNNFIDIGFDNNRKNKKNKLKKCQLQKNLLKSCLLL